MGSKQFATEVKGAYWLADSGLDASQIDPSHCTHIFCAFANLNTKNNELDVPESCRNFPEIIRRKNPSVKAILSIGGGHVRSADFNTMAMKAETRKTFIESSITKAIDHGFDGLDLDWEHQTNTQEMENLGAFLYEWKAAVMKREDAKHLILTAALVFRPHAYTGPDFAFPIQAISDNLDWVNVMAYDLYDPARESESTKTKPHAALYDPSGSNVTGSAGITGWINAGVPAKKLVLGLPFYGYAWRLKNPENHGILAPAKGVDVIQGTTKPSYRLIREFIDSQAASAQNDDVVYDGAYVTNYYYSVTTWITYDDKEAIATKVHYAKNTASLLGYFSWCLNDDLGSTLSTIYSFADLGCLATHELDSTAVGNGNLSFMLCRIYIRSI